MTANADHAATQFILIVLFILLGLFALLIIYVVFRRVLMNYVAGKIESAQDEILSHLYRYLDGEISRQEFAGLLTNRYIVVAAFRNIKEMMQSIEGEQRILMENALDIPVFKEYYLKKLVSKNVVHIAQACIYFEKKNIADNRVIERLIQLQWHSYPVIDYAATLALINTKSQALKDRALNNFLKKDGHSTMAVNDIVFEYYKNHPDKDSAADMMFSRVKDQNTPAHYSASIVRIFPELGLYQLAEGLFTLFEGDLPHDKHGMLTAAIIDDLNQFSVKDLTPLLFKKKTWESEHQPVRLSTARWMQRNYRKELDPILIRLASDSDLEVRIVAQSALLQSAEKASVQNTLPSALWREWEEIKQSGGRLADTF